MSINMITPRFRYLLVIAATVLVGIVLFFTFVHDKNEQFRPYLMSPELHCSDGTVLRPYDAGYEDFCPNGAGGILHFRVPMGNNGFEDRTGMTAYWPAYPGDCWPPEALNVRTICDRFLADRFPVH